MIVRPYTDDDAERAVAFLAAAGRLDATLVPPPLAEWRAFTARSFNRGAGDFVVVEEHVEGESDDDSECSAVIAIMMSSRFEDDGHEVRNFRIIVHPTHRRRGIGSAVYERLLGQDPTGDVTLQCHTPEDWVAGCAFLAKRGFREARRCHFLRIDAAPDACPPGGVEIRPYAGTDVEDTAWCRLNDDGFKGGPEYSDLTSRDLVTLRGEPGFALALARIDDAIVGLCHVKDFGGAPWINSVVVARAHRGKGIGRSLMLYAMGSETRRPLRLSVLEKNAAARALYASLGFRVDREEITWWRE